MKLARGATNAAPAPSARGISTPAPRWKQCSTNCGNLLSNQKFSSRTKSRMRFFALLLLLATATSLLSAQQPAAPAQAGPPWNLMPVPAKLQAGSGQWLVNQALTVSVAGADDPRVRAASQRFVEHLARETGIPLRYQSAEADKGTIAIHCERMGEKVQKLGEDESYVLDVTDSGAKLSAPKPLGVIHGLQTLLQLVAPSAEGFAAPAV